MNTLSECLPDKLTELDVRLYVYIKTKCNELEFSRNKAKKNLSCSLVGLKISLNKLLSIELIKRKLVQAGKCYRYAYSIK